MTAARPGDLVVVTGATSGIGEAVTRRLAVAGFVVAAGYRSSADRERVAGLGPGVDPLCIDVTDDTSVAAAAERIAASPLRLAALVNNAGIAVGGPIEHVPADAWRAQFEVNVVGVAAVTAALLPRLRRDRGRVVMMSSVSGRRSAPILGPYAASKFALTALADALRMETVGTGVDVVLVEPGGVRTEIWNKVLDDAPGTAAPVYRPFVAAARAIARRMSTRGLDPDEVAAVVERSLVVRRPRTRYPLGRTARAQSWAARLLPDRWFDRLRTRAMLATPPGDDEA